jgi:hypothetical protein
LLKRLLLSTLLLLGLAVEAQAAELLMFRRAGCPWCQAWDEAIGPGYPKSDLGRLLPLRTVDLDRDPAPAVALLRPVLFTPTFVVADEGREIGRIEGYPGQDFFWACSRSWLAACRRIRDRALREADAARLRQSSPRDASRAAFHWRGRQIAGTNRLMLD